MAEDAERLDLAGRLDIARRNAGLSTERLAAELFVTSRTVRRYVSGERRPPEDVVAAWEQACGLERDALRGHGPDRSRSENLTSVGPAVLSAEPAVSDVVPDGARSETPQHRTLLEAVVPGALTIASLVGGVASLISGSVLGALFALVVCVIFGLVASGRATLSFDLGRSGLRVAAEPKSEAFGVEQGLERAPAGELSERKRPLGIVDELAVSEAQPTVLAEAATATPLPTGTPEQRFGAALRAARLESGLTLRALAQRLYLSHSSLVEYERGYRLAPVDVVRRYEAALGLEAETLIAPHREARAQRTALGRDGNLPGA